MLRIEEVHDAGRATTHDGAHGASHGATHDASHDAPHDATHGAIHDGRLTLRAAGQLSGPWVDELARSLRAHSANPALVLDLRDVSFVDADGVQLLRSIQTEHRISLRCSAFVAAQLA
jgi:hypothetical protein